MIDAGVEEGTVTTAPRIQTTAGRLAALGFADGARAERLLDALGPEAVGDFDLLDDLVAAADPDLALGSVSRLAERDPSVLGTFRDDPVLRRRLFGVLGLSAALGDHVVRHPDCLQFVQAVGRPTDRELREDLLLAVGADPEDAEPVADGPPQPVADGSPQPAPGTGAGGRGAALDALRVAYRSRVLHIAARDVAGDATLAETAATLADLAGAAIDAALAIARAETPDSGDVRLAVIGMGKCGARELNYISDVDVVFVAEPKDGVDETKALQTATRLAQAMMKACSTSTPEGSLWEVDAGLRPEGKMGPLVRTLDSHLTYYRRWAKTWEFQALLKARPIAGDLELGQAYVAAVNEMVWQAAARPHFVEDVQAMRRRVEAHVRASEAERQIKLGPGGLRDIEFAVQLLQLVHGRSEPLLRRRATLSALAALSRGGFVGRDDAKALAEAYTFLRQVEHMIQLYRLRRTHVVPSDTADLRRIGRGLGMTTDPVGEFTTTWKRHALEVRRLHEKLFYRPLLQAVARLPESETRLSAAAAKARLEALGYADPDGALRHIAGLTSGVSRRAAIQRTLLPVMLGWFADAPDPDAGLLGFRQVSDKLGSTPWYLRLLRDETAVAERLARVLGTSRYVTGMLLHAPEAVGMLGETSELAVRPASTLAGEAASAVNRHGADAETAVTAIRALRRKELLRTACADLFGLIDIEEVGGALSSLNDVTIQAALDATINKVCQGRREDFPTRLSVIAMGRLGGLESSYASDADVMFVHAPLPGVPERDAAVAAQTVAEEMRKLLAQPAPDPPLQIDAGLRPEGRQGPLVRTIASYRAYYERWSSHWEAQALMRARFCAGDAGLGAEFMDLIDPMRYSPEGISVEAVREMRKLKARMEAERLPRGADPTLHTKLGRGGLSDVEWVAQLIQLRHAGAVPALRTTRTLDALRAAAAEGLLEQADEAVLAEAWRFASRVRDAIMLVRGRAADSIPGAVKERVLISRALGYPPDGSEDLIEDYRRATRRARAVAERLLYED
ncbi:bifunctional [glutamine synthetase] adenylyltransferase/[glutamine synthetase]-adenylyl-L-tyrosine phosphorylase [Planotetraspora kaengkrachanensis]|uniref:bifunctional [glutamine synthetase] adenylyltransferase/[glutamine synthetase]-adenylyl-L-tyrosine phosphorylase n=1 Tax=Planotetraspora kaengkrachanensis TaxID=575193 RepID=UPI003570E326